MFNVTNARQYATMLKAALNSQLPRDSAWIRNVDREPSAANVVTLSSFLTSNYDVNVNITITVRPVPGIDSHKSLDILAELVTETCNTLFSSRLETVSAPQEELLNANVDLYAVHLPMVWHIYGSTHGDEAAEFARRFMIEAAAPPKPVEPTNVNDSRRGLTRSPFS